MNQEEEMSFAPTALQRMTAERDTLAADKADLLRVLGVADARIKTLEAALRPTEAEIEVAADEWPWQEKTKGEGFRAGIAWLQGRVVLLPQSETSVQPDTHKWENTTAATKDVLDQYFANDRSAKP